MKIYDLSPRLSPSTAVFPGDIPFSRDVTMSFAAGNHLELSSIRSSLHIGSHADAVSHYSGEGAGISDRDLNYYIGPAVVVRAFVQRGQRVGIDQLSEYGKKRLSESDRLPGRFLLGTGTFPNPNDWNSDFASYSPDLIHRLAGRGVCLIGIDTPSIDPETSKELESHSAVYRLNLAVLEGLCLNGVPEGEYTLFAAPLKISDGDAGPVRALLIDGKLVDKSLDAPAKFLIVDCETSA